MKLLIASILSLSLSFNCLADVSINDLPFLEGTPLTANGDSNEEWAVLDYLEGENGIIWVWFQRNEQQAYVIYPSKTFQDSVTFPDSNTFNIIPERVNIIFLGTESQEVTLSRFGGNMIVLGDDIRISYTLGEFLAAKDYLLNSPQSLDATFLSSQVQFSNTATFGGANPSTNITSSDSTTTGSLSITTSGEITYIEGGTAGANAFSDEGLANHWKPYEPNSGSSRFQSESAFGGDNNASTSTSTSTAPKKKSSGSVSATEILLFFIACYFFSINGRHSNQLNLSAFRCSR